MSHPTDLQLVDYIDGALADVERAAVEAHLRECAACRALVDDAPEPLLAPVDVDLPSGAAAMAAAFAAASSSAPGPVVPGALWRVAWAGEAGAVLVVEDRGMDIEAIPVVFDPITIGGQTVLLAAEETGLGVLAAAWVGLRRLLPVAAFTHRLADVRIDALERVTRLSPDVNPATSSAEEAPARCALVLTLHRLQEARWEPPAPQRRPDVNFAERLRGAGVRPSQLAEALGVAPSEVTDILRGRRALAPDEVVTVADVLGLSASELPTGPAYDAGLVLELQRPRWRALLEERAGRSSRSLAEEREHVAQAILVMAARTTGAKRGSPDWAQLVEDQLAGR